MAEVVAIMEVEQQRRQQQQQQQNQIVARCIHHVPDHMNIKEGYHLMTLLYEFGILSKYLARLDAAEGENDYYRNYSFSDFFNFNNGNYIKLDPETGRIKFLSLARNILYDDDDDDNDDDDDDYGDDDEKIGPPYLGVLYRPINVVPPTIEQFQGLESIEFSYCRSLIMELGNLPLLKKIQFCECPKNFFENIPEGFRFPSSVKEVRFIRSKYDSLLLTSFFKILPNTLEHIFFDRATREQIEGIFRVLQHHYLSFRHSLTMITMRYCDLNDDDLNRLMFEIRERFPKLHTINVNCNDIKSVCGINDRIKQILLPSSLSSSLGTIIIPDNNLRKLNLNGNPVLNHMILGGCERDCGYVTKDPNETSALLNVLDEFNGISNLGLYSRYDPGVEEAYDPYVEYALRINHAGRKSIRTDAETPYGASAATNTTTTTTTKPVINKALWPIILERAYKKSNEIYMYNIKPGKEDINKRKCATGLFDLVLHYWPSFMDRRKDIYIDNNNDNLQMT